MSTEYNERNKTVRTETRKYRAEQNIAERNQKAKQSQTNKQKMERKNNKSVEVIILPRLLVLVLLVMVVNIYAHNILVWTTNLCGAQAGERRTSCPVNGAFEQPCPCVSRILDKPLCK